MLKQNKTKQNRPFSEEFGVEGNKETLNLLQNLAWKAAGLKEIDVIFESLCVILGWKDEC